MWSDNSGMILHATKLGCNVVGNSPFKRVFTDDGWKFRCKTSGDHAKNFRSEDNLEILGTWIKGRMEGFGKSRDELLQIIAIVLVHWLRRLMRPEVRYPGVFSFLRV